MARYAIDNGTVLDTDMAKNKWDGDKYWNGTNRVSIHTNNPFVSQDLYESSKGTFYTVTTSMWQGTHPYAEILSEKEATQWLLLQGEGVPGELHKYIDEIVE